MKRFLATIRRVASKLAARWGTGRDYVLRPWTAEEEAAFQRFCASIGQVPEDPIHAQLMEDGPIDFFTVDPFWEMDLPQA